MCWDTVNRRRDHPRPWPDLLRKIVYLVAYIATVAHLV
jgi:hypothetical protein